VSATAPQCAIRVGLHRLTPVAGGACRWRNANRTGTLPELLVKAVRNRGDGLFGSVDHIQRLDTYGGPPPAGSCTNGAITASQYFATEDFLAPGASA
jgi:hypothetical protein